MTNPGETIQAAEHIACLLQRGCQSFLASFASVTQRSKSRFEQRDWRGMQHDASERLLGIRRILAQTARATADVLRTQGEHDRTIWRMTRHAYATGIRGTYDQEISETFFNSIARKLFFIIGVDDDLEFVILPPRQLRTHHSDAIVRRFPLARPDPRVLLQLLQSYAFAAPFENLARDSHLVTESLREQLHARGKAHDLVAIETLIPVFFRNKGAYIVGRICTTNGGTNGDTNGGADGGVLPFVLPLLHHRGGIVVDAVLIDEDTVSIIFSFTRSFFHVDTYYHRDIIAFLRTILPLKRVAELYISIGHVRHGKREYHADLHRHLETASDTFAIAPGQEGMVMLVFTLPSYDVVFKVIRDRFVYPKMGNRKQVMEKYRFVFEHDRVGRLVDAQEFEFLEFARARFSPALMNALTQTCAGNLLLDGDRVIIRHLYVERRVTPLNIYLRTADADAARAAALDYGYLIRDLAAANVFPGDLFLKNFGVTRHGRVVFYDYDELSSLTDLRFRRFPQAHRDEDALSRETWFRVAEGDVFPEELLTFLGLHGATRDAFLDVHGEIFDVAFWQRMQELNRNGEVLDIFPYPRSLRLQRQT